MTEAKNGRDGKGRFVAGNKAGKGKGRPRSEYAAAFERVITPEMFDKLILRAYIDGMKGDQASRAWLVERVLGKVPNILELRAADAAVLRELLDHFERQGIPASDVFHAMLTQIALEAEVENED